LNGVVNVVKPPLITSFKVVEIIKRKFKLRHVGHLGVLDPIATGLLQIAVGSATKLFEYFTGLERSYRAELLLGISTDTQDAAGRPIKISEDVDISNLEEIVDSFKGEITQIPPMYSSLHYKGKRLYELAREGIEVPRTPRNVLIKHIDIIDVKKDRYPRVILDVVCQRGTYIRTLCHDIGEKLGVGAHMLSLVRTRIGNIDLPQAYSLTEILGRGNSIAEYFMPWGMLSEIEKIDLIVKKQRDDFIKGKPILLYKTYYSRREFVSVWYNNECIGVGRCFQDVLYPIAVENLNVS